MKRVILVFPFLFLISCGSVPEHDLASHPKSVASNPLEEFVMNASYEPNLPRGEQITSPSDEIAVMLRRFKEEGKKDNLPFLLEYGLKLHWINLQHTNLARELPVEKNPVIAELIRLTGIPKYTTAHEAGWLNRQFYGPFQRTGWSSYQVYIWLKEAELPISKLYPNSHRISVLLKAIDSSGKNGVGGRGVCHYHCR